MHSVDDGLLSRLFYRDNFVYFFSIVLALIITIKIAAYLRLCLRIKLSKGTIIKTVIFYFIILFFPVAIAPAFFKIFEEMNIHLPSPTVYSFLLSKYSGIIFLYTLSLAIFSPLITDTMCSALPQKSVKLLRWFSRIYIAILVLFPIWAVFFPLF